MMGFWCFWGCDLETGVNGIVIFVVKGGLWGYIPGCDNLLDFGVTVGHCVPGGLI